MKRLVLVGILVLVAPGCSKKTQDSKPAAAASAAATKVQVEAAAPSAPPRAPQITVTSVSPQAIEAFRKGRDLWYNVRVPEALSELKRAVALDPKFALAYAFLGLASPGAEGDEHTAKAVALAGALPEAERTVIEAVRAQRQGDFSKANELRRKAVALVPTDWRAQYAISAFAWDEARFDEAVATARKATELSPRSAAPYNLLGLALAQQGKFDDALAALSKYVSLRPMEPNPQDSFGEVLLMAGRYEEAEAAFRKAVSLAPSFGMAWHGVALTKLLRGDFAGGREAFAKQKAAQVLPDDKLDADADLALGFLAEGKPAEALRVLDAVDQDAVLHKSVRYQAWTPYWRALVLLEQGQAAQAQAQLATALQRCRTLPIPGAERSYLEVFAQALLVRAHAALGQHAQAEEVVATLEQAARKAQTIKALQSAVRRARGELALAKKDLPAAVRELSQCQDEDALCLLARVTALEQSGDKAGAEATRQKLLKPSRRDTIHVLARQKLASNTGK